MLILSKFNKFKQLEAILNKSEEFSDKSINKIESNSIKKSFDKDKKTENSRLRESAYSLNSQNPMLIDSQQPHKASTSPIRFQNTFVQNNNSENRPDSE